MSEDDENKQRVGDAWNYKKVFGTFSAGGTKHFYPSWQPGVWSSVCVAVSKTSRFMAVNINGDNVATNRYYGVYHQHDVNIFLMDPQQPSDGAVTDVNVWRRILTEEEIRQWHHCRTEPEGKVINWDTAELNINNLDTSEVDREQTCLKTAIGTDYISYGFHKYFLNSDRFCVNIGGRFAFPKDPQNYVEIRKKMTAVSLDDSATICQHPKYIYTQFKRFNGDWLDSNTGAPMVWDNWKQGFPNEKEDFDCVIQDLQTGKLENSNCKRPLCPVCEMTTARKNFILSGVCMESSVDVMFVMERLKEFLGYIQSTMRFSQVSSRWEIVNTTNTSHVLAFMGSTNTAEFPIGVNHWYFLDTNCTDPGQQVRSLNLHLEVEQPGHFCCDDGTCVPSQLVCNHFSDCQDATDERNCTFIHVMQTVNKGRVFLFFRCCYGGTNCNRMVH